LSKTSLVELHQSRWTKAELHRSRDARARLDFA
jgi:hypothetical protein